MSAVWDQRFYQVAKDVATWSKDPKKKVGAVIVSPDRRQMTYGFNGFPRDIKDDQRLLTHEKNMLTLHAELNAILNAKQDLEAWTLYCTYFPCLHCALAIVQSGITRVLSPQINSQSSWFEEQRQALRTLHEANVKWERIA